MSTPTSAISKRCAKSAKPGKPTTRSLQILPITIQDQVANAVTRQSNAYFSSSDADVQDRAEAEQLWDALRAGKVRVKSGWHLLQRTRYLDQSNRQQFLGLRLSYDDVVIDPVLPNNWMAYNLPLSSMKTHHRDLLNWK